MNTGWFGDEDDGGRCHGKYLLLVCDRNIVKQLSFLSLAGARSVAGVVCLKAGVSFRTIRKHWRCSMASADALGGSCDMIGDLSSLTVCRCRINGRGWRSGGLMASLIGMLFVFLFATVLQAGGSAARPAINWDNLTDKDADLEGLLVGFKTPTKGADARAVTAKHMTLHAKAGSRIKRAFTLVPVHSVKITKGRSLKEVAAIYAADPDVAYVEPNYKVHAMAVPNDPQYGSLWGMPRIRAPQAWDKTTGSTNVVVGIIDTGIDRSHPDLAANMWVNPGEAGSLSTNGIDDDGNGYVDDWRGWDFVNNDNDPFDDNSHGTHVAGTIGGVGNNSIGVVGVNWTVKMVGLKFLDAGGSGYTDDAVDAVQYAATKVSGVRLTSNSWGGGGYSQALKDAIDAAAAAGQLFIAAAGNASSDNDANASYPSGYTCANIIAVASITSAGSLSGFSNYGATTVDIGAPGSEILSTVPGGGYDTKSGTSMATPHVSGAAALLWSLDPSLSWMAIRDAILDSARPNTALSGKVVTGGELDVNAAIEKLNPPVLGASVYAVLEGGTTNIGVRLFKQPVADMTVTVARVSGSANLYVAGGVPLVFTPANWSNTQEFAVGALNDADMTNDAAYFMVSAMGGGTAGFTLYQMDLGDTIPPQCSFSGSLSADGSQVLIDILFDESVTGFDSSDILYSSINCGASLVSLTDVSGGAGQRYQAAFSVSSRFGSVSLTIPAGSLTDMSGNSNPNPEYRFTYTIPFVRMDYFDDFEGAATSWTPSTDEFEDYTTIGWKWGAPVFGTGWTGPVAAASATKCLGVMDGPFAKRLDAWIESPAIRVGGSPLLSFNLWMEGGSYAFGKVEINNGYGWYDMTPTGYFSKTSNMWVRQEVELDNDLFGDRVLRVRFRAVARLTGGICPMYVDDVMVQSQPPPGIYLTSVSPDSGAAGTNVLVSLSIYNSTASEQSNLMGYVTCADAGVTITNGIPVFYGNVGPGGLVTGAAPFSLKLAASGGFDTARLTLNHQAKSGWTAVSSDTAMFTVLDAGVTGVTNLMTVSTLSGVANWVGEFLPGDGNSGSCLFQVIAAGSNGVVDPPDADGGTTGDDRLLVGAVDYLSAGRMGEGGVVPDAGLFSRIVSHGLASNSLVYVRAWDASSFAGAAAYGDSALKAVSGASGETISFGGWGVATPWRFPGASLKDMVDRDGDSIPDAWCVQFGINPNRPIEPLPASVTMEASVTGLNRPGRVAVSSNLVFIADSDNNRIEVWNRSLTIRLVQYGSLGTGTNNFNRPQGLSVNASGTRLMVGDTLNNRITMFAVDPVAGTLTHLWTEGTMGAVTNGNLFFRSPYGVALGAGDRFLVADSHSSDFYAHHSVHIYPSVSDPVTLIGLASGSGSGSFMRPLGVGSGPAGEVYVADSGNHRLQGFLSDGTFSWAVGAYGTNSSQFKDPRDVSLGIGGRLYVAETGGSRIQIMDVVAAPDVASIAVLGSSGSGPGQFRAPQGVAPALDDGIIYVADTYNNRVQKLRVILDGDGDGMEDVWEELHGLDCHDPSDAFTDPDGDGLSNIGEYRLGTDPGRRDTNGNGASDGWDVAHGLNPAGLGGTGVVPPTVVITSDAAGTVYPGMVVRVTASFSEPVTNSPGPKLSLDGGAFLWQASMSMSGPSTWYYDYTVQAGNSGPVNAAVGGAVDLQGYSQDLDPTVQGALFTVSSVAALEIAGFGGFPKVLSWDAVLDGIYQIESSLNLMSNLWNGVGGVTSPVNGTLKWTNSVPATNAVEFFRIKWMNAP